NPGPPGSSSIPIPTLILTVPLVLARGADIQGYGASEGNLGAIGRVGPDHAVLLSLDADDVADLQPCRSNGFLGIRDGEAGHVRNGGRDLARRRRGRASGALQERDQY